MTIAVLLSPNFVIVISQDDAASCASEASRMELSSSVRFQVLALDAAVAGSTHRSVEFVIMAFTVRRVVEHIKLCCWERVAARSAYKALLVVPSCKAA
jgi:hypothetical protein